MKIHPCRRMSFRRRRGFVLSWLLFGSACAANAAAPNIYHQPQSQTVVLYQPALFSVEASGPYYQWRKDGVPMAGATSHQLVVAHAQFSNAGLYSVVVSNAASSVTSSNVVLAVNSPRGGDIDFLFSSSNSINSYVQALAVQPDGKVIIGGSFTTVNGAARARIARLYADGTTDASFMSGLSGANGGVTSIALQSDGKVVIGGGFTTVNGVGRNRIARLNADGTLDGSFQNQLSGANNVINSIALQDDLQVLIGGSFTRINGVIRTNIARLNPDGNLDTSFQSTASLANGGSVSSIVLQKDGKLLIGGNFTNVNGVVRNRIARLNQDGTLDTSFVPVAGSPLIAIQSDGQVLAGTTRLNVDGSLDASFKKPSVDGFGVYSLAVQSNGKVLIAGQFTKVNGVGRNSIARLNSDGMLDTSFQDGLSGVTWNSGAARVESLTVQSDGRVLIGGDFGEVNGVPATYFTRLWGEDFPPPIKSIQASGANVNLTWHSISNRTYRVQHNANLSATNWTDLGGDVFASGATAGKTDSTTGNASQRFYRVLLLP